MLEYALLAVGFLLLLKGADALVDGSSSLAKKIGVQPLVIGLTIVAFGTSMPEMAVNILAAFRGAADISFGNILGSNIANILLILGISSLIIPLKVQHSTVWREIPFAMLATIVLFVQSHKNYFNGSGAATLTRTNGLVLLCFFALFLYYVYTVAKNKPHEELEGVETKYNSLPVIFSVILASLVALYFGGRWVVDGAVAIAKLLGLSELFISATIIAIGTSLPELVTSIVAARKKEFNLSVGNIIGSNIFNIFLVMGVTATIAPAAVPAGISTDFFFLFGATIALFAAMFIGRKHELERWQGGLFLIGYAMYLAFLLIRG